MTRLILKYELDPTSGGQHAIPEGSRFLDLQVQQDRPVMWWSVPKDQVPPPLDLSEPSKEMRRDWKLRTFTICRTGGPGYIEESVRYVGTFQLADGFVGHVLSWEPVPREVVPTDFGFEVVRLREEFERFVEEQAYQIDGLRERIGELDGVVP